MSKQEAKEQVVAAYDGGERDDVRLANQFGVSESSVRLWLRLAHRGVRSTDSNRGSSVEMDRRAYIRLARTFAPVEQGI